MQNLEKIKLKAIELHENQKYGIYPYDVHLINVSMVLLRNGVSTKNEIGYKLFASAWLHNILEDTSITKKSFIDSFGRYIYDIVWALTDGEGSDREQKKKMMYKKIISNQEAIIVKLADRIANLEFSIILGNRSKINMYVSENEKLNKILKDIITTSLGIKLLGDLNILVMNCN